MGARAAQSQGPQGLVLLVHCYEKAAKRVAFWAPLAVTLRALDRRCCKTALSGAQMVGLVLPSHESDTIVDRAVACKLYLVNRCRMDPHCLGGDL